MVLGWIDKAESTKGKTVLVSDDLRTRMVKPRSPEPGVWKKNERRKAWPEWKSTSSFLMEKYATARRQSVFNRLGGINKEGHRCIIELRGTCMSYDVKKSVEEMAAWVETKAGPEGATTRGRYNRET
jgi:hypothetical protein